MPEQAFQFSKEDFGKDFAWGVASAAFQVEGAHDLHGKGPSVWDRFTSLKGTVFQGHNARVACDFYHRYKEDLSLMQAMNLRNFRFSISWPRLLPTGKGAVSIKGVDFYNRLIDNCLEKGITPWVTLYHWDLPQALQNDGGWANRNIVGWFGEYAALCAGVFGDRVAHWMVLNEPMVFTGAGYFLGVHAPGEKGLKNFLPAVHHAVLCQAEGGRILRDCRPNATIGTTFSSSYITPYSPRRKDRVAAEKVDALLNRLFLEPSLGLGYPTGTLDVLKRLSPYIKPGDMDAACFNFDFIGLQHYTREVVAHSYMVPYLHARIVKASRRQVPATLMGWEVYPEGMYQMLSRFSSYTGVKKIVVTENGASFKDELKDGRVEDPRRLRYLQRYLEAVLSAKRDGARVGGYFVWTFTDNFEWAEGYYPRFGLVYVDFPTQERILKSSGHWFSQFLE